MENNKNYASQIKEIADNLLLYINSGELPRLNDVENIIRDEVEDLLNFEKPEIMVAGIYSAGKSTLINALCRRQVAEVAASPTTDHIAKYAYRDYLLVDSPGVDAPIEHEEITDEQIRKCHVLLFVISTGQFESRANYQKMYDWIKSGIPFVIIINDKMKLTSLDAQEIETIKNKAIHNLRDISKSDSIADSYDIIAVNAQRACDVYFNGKNPLMLEASNISALEDKIDAITQKEGTMRMLANPIANLMNVLDEYEKKLTAKLSDAQGADNELKISQLYKKRDSIDEDFRVQVRCIISQKESLMVNSIIAGRSIGEINESLTKELGMLYETKLQEFLMFVGRYFKADVDAAESDSRQWNLELKNLPSLTDDEKDEIKDVVSALPVNAENSESEESRELKENVKDAGTLIGYIVAGPIGAAVGRILGSLAGEAMTGEEKAARRAAALASQAEEENRLSNERV